MTHQQHQHVIRESERARLESTRDAAKNTLRVTPAGIAVAVDRAGRTVSVQLDCHALLELSRAVNEAIALARRDDDVAPDTVRNV